MGTERVTDGGFASITISPVKVVSGITKATPGVVTFAASHGYADGDVIYFSLLDGMTELNGEYWKLREKSGDTFQLSNAAIGTWDGSSLDTSGFGAAEVSGNGRGQYTHFTSWTGDSGQGWHPDVDGAGALTGYAACDGEQATSADLEQTVTVVKNQTYRTVFAVVVRQAGTSALVLDGTAGTSRSTQATFTEYIIAGGSGDKIELRADSSFIGSINAVSTQLAFAITPTIAVPMPPVAHNIITQSESMKKNYQNLGTNTTNRYLLQFQTMTTANMIILRNHYYLTKNGYDAFYWDSPPSTYIDTDFDGTADSTALNGRWVPGSMKISPNNPFWNCEAVFEEDV